MNAHADPAEKDAIQASAEYVALVARIHETYRHPVMDTPEDRAIHARHVAIADKALALATERLAALGARPIPPGNGDPE